ncbi:hypothetical protein M0L22_RS04405 [Providencia rettgeri]|nr:hypothetical protein [Providencia rettgeri]ELL9148670.1 hypothetical protein [Providencia rettgeri]
MKKISVLTLAVTFSVFFSSTMAETISGQSQSYDNNMVNIRIDETESTMGPHGGALGTPGIGYRSIAGGKTISFSGLKSSDIKKPDNVYLLDGTTIPHGNMGKFQFSQVADAEVYFGDWSQTGVNGDTTHTAYFSGENAMSEVPSSGQANYTLEGINQFDGETKLIGSFTADFNDKSYKGSLKGKTLSISMGGNIAEQGKFSGNAIANDTITGSSMGQLFGDNAEQVAGITSFKGHEHLDTAFGGKKD